MKPTIPLVLAVTALAASLHAQPTSEAAADFNDLRNRFQIGARAGFNLHVDFRNESGAIPAFAGPATGGGIDRSYANGFVRVDASGNAGGETWNWGYQTSDQLVGGAAGVAFESYSGNPYGGTFGADGDPQWGGELAYTRILGNCLGGHWGLELGLAWTDFEVRDSDTHGGSLTRITDTFALGGVVAPTAPYAGSFDGPGPVLSDTPDRTLATVTTSVAGTRRLRADLYGFRLGPMLEIPLGESLSAQVSGGLAVALFDGGFDFAETAMLPGAGLWVRSGSVEESDWLLGGYVRGQLTLRLTDQVGLYGAAEYQGLESLTLRTGGRAASLDFGGGISLGLGLTIRF